MSRRTPLAWNNLVHDRGRLAVAVAGVGFAVLLIFMQLGFMNALLESTVQLLRKLNGELILISSVRYTLPANERIELRRVEQAKGEPGVAAVYPVYIETVAGALRRRNDRAYPIRVIAMREEQPVFNGLPLIAQAPDIGLPASALADVASRSKFGIPGRADELAEYEAELSGKRIHIVGLFRLGVDFATEGNLIMTASNFASFFPQRARGRDPLSLVDLAVVKLIDGEDPLTVQRLLRQALPSDVQVFTRQQLIDREKSFWRTNAPIGYIFLMGVYVGFVVGVVICYQIIYSDIAGHMREFATLKAMGYSSAYFVRLILSQSVILSLLGFIPGAASSFVCYQLLARFTGLTVPLTVSLAATVLLVTLLMCFVSGMLALRKLLIMDPAELF